MYKELLGYKIFSDNKEELLKEIENKKRVNIISGNPEVLYNGIKNEFLKNSFTKEDALIIPDGVGTLLAAKINGIDITEKIAGIEVMNMLLEEARDKKLYVLARSVQKGGMRLTYGDVSRAGDYEYIEYTLEYPLSAAMFGYSSQHTYNGLARYFVS